MRPDAFRNAFVGLLLSLVAVLLGACGGGGATNVNAVAQGGILNVNGNATATAYAGVPFTLTIVGGKPPYVLISSEPSVFPLPNTTSNNTVTVVPNNPSTIDSGLPAGDLPVRSVTVTVRDTSNQTASNVVKVAQNYLIGYGLTLTPSTCPSGSATTAANGACSGGESALRFYAATNGGFAAGHTFTVTNIKGHYSLRNPATGQTGNSVQAVADATGQVIVIVNVPTNQQSEVGVVRIQDTATGQYADDAFLINGVAGSTTGTGSLTIIPNAVSYTGPLTTTCGTGNATVLVFDGTPPYTAQSADASVIVTPINPSAQPGVFNVYAWNPAICLSKATVTFMDSVGRRGTMTVDTAVGKNTPPALTVAPTTVTVACGQTATVSVAGGLGTITVASTHPRIIAFVQGNQVGISRAVGDGATAYPATGTVSITDGATVASVDVTTPVNCP